MNKYIYDVVIDNSKQNIYKIEKHKVVSSNNDTYTILKYDDKNSYGRKSIVSKRDVFETLEDAKKFMINEVKKTISILDENIKKDSYFKNELSKFLHNEENGMQTLQVKGPK